MFKTVFTLNVFYHKFVRFSTLFLEGYMQFATQGNFKVLGLRLLAKQFENGDIDVDRITVRIALKLSENDIFFLEVHSL